jgi:hypothetical protein
MPPDELKEIDKICSPYSILVIKANGELIRLDCPFTVVVIVAIDNLGLNQTVKVLQVKVDRHLILVYIINSRAYHYYHFAILLL